MFNQKMYVLNEFLEFTPIGVMGEIHIGGAGVALNYWNDIAKTNKSFIVHDKLGRLYKTGDLGVFRDDGNIEFIGRKDTQVKVGGHRIELGEVEKTIGNYPIVKNVAIDVVGDKFGTRHIAAYIVLKNQKDKLDHTLSRPGIRRDGFIGKAILLPEIDFSKDAIKQYFARKSYRNFTKKHLNISKLSKDILDSEACLQKSFNPQPCKYDIDKLGKLCSIFHGYINEELVLPKYRYPSAGSLYPVRIYLRIYKNISKLAKGIYYYHVDDHKLLKISELKNPKDYIQRMIQFSKIRSFVSPQKEHSDSRNMDTLEYKIFDIIFSSCLPVLEAAYGEWSVPFSYLEAGYMLNLLYKEAESLNLSYDINILNDVRNKDEELGILSVSFYDEKTANKSSLPKVNKYYLERQVGNTFILYKWKDNNFIELEEWKTKFQFGQERDNLAIFNEASGYIIYSASNKREYIASGFESQYLMENSWKDNIGYCGIGVFKTDTVLKKHLDKDVIHTALAVGKITNEQIKIRRTSQVDAIDGLVAVNPIDELKKYIRNKLPEYMMPSYFNILDELPLTSTGKVDRKALAKTLEIENKRSRKILLPREELEITVANIWKELLGIKIIGLNDNFFTKGGDSLKATQLINKYKSIFNIEISLKDIFTHPELIKQVHIIKNKKVEKIGLKAPTHFENRDTYPASSSQSRLYFLDKYDSSAGIDYIIPFVMKIKGNLDLNILEKSISHILAQHSVFSTAFNEIDGEIHQIIQPIKPVSFNIEELREKEIEHRINQSIHTPFDLNKGYLYRTNLYKVKGCNEYVFDFTHHHIISDGWSTALLQNELSELYTSFSEKRKIKLNKLPINYGDFSVWHNEIINSSAVDSQKKFWENYLKGHEPLNLPYSFKKKNLLKNLGGIITLPSQNKLIRRLSHILKKNMTPLFSTSFMEPLLFFCTNIQIKMILQ